MPLHPEPLIATGERPEPWDQTFTLAASDLTFLWQECRRCFYLKVLMGARQLTTIPSVFTQMDREQRRFFDGHSPREIHPDLPAGRMLCDETKVVSVPLAVPGTDARVRLRGVLDCLVACNSGGFGVLVGVTDYRGQLTPSLASDIPPTRPRSR